MSCGTCESHDRSRPRFRGALVGIYITAIALSLYLHVFRGWSPWSLVPALVVLAHAAVFGILGLIVARMGRRAGGPIDRAEAHTHPSALITRPHLYDLFVRAATLGGEDRLRRSVLALARLKPGDALLDVGCGTGSQLLLAAPIVGAEGRLCGVEPSAPMVERARAKAKARGVDMRVSQSLAEHLPYGDGAFDVVVCTMVLHHLPESHRVAAVAEMHRVLRPGGRLVVADIQRPRSISAIFSIISIAHLSAPHSLLSPEEVDDLLVRAGFIEIDRQIGGGAVGSVVAVRGPSDQI